MSETFKVGEVAILNHPGLPVCDVEIVEGLAHREWLSIVHGDTRYGLSYGIRFGEHPCFYCRPKYLRKRREPPPPLDFTAGEWDLIPYKPPARVAST